MKHAARSSSAIGIRGSQGGSTNASRTAGPSGPATSSWAVLNRPATAHASDVLAGGGRHLLQQPTSGGSSRQASAGGPRPRSVSGRQRDSSTQSQDKGPGTSAGYVRIQPGPASEGGAAQSIRKLSTRERAMREMSSRRRRYERSQKKAAEADLVQETEDTSSAWRTRPGSSPTLVRCKPSGNRTEASPSASAEPVRHAISSVYIASTNKEHLRGEKLAHSNLFRPQAASLFLCRRESLLHQSLHSRHWLFCLPLSKNLLPSSPHSCFVHVVCLRLG